ncbi:MAG: hypothetical protein ACI4QT_08570 [Kiritimatiellia bacterium]
MTMANEIECPSNCGECALFMRRRDNPSHGWCSNWGGVDLTEENVCYPNFGRKRNAQAKEGAK